MYHRTGVGEVSAEVSFSTGGGGGTPKLLDPMLIPVPDCAERGWACAPLVLWMQDHAPEGLRGGSLPTLVAGLKKGLVGMNYQGVSLTNMGPGIGAVMDAVLYYQIDARVPPAAAKLARDQFRLLYTMAAAPVVKEVSAMAPPARRVVSAAKPMVQQIQYRPTAENLTQGVSPPLTPAPGISPLVIAGAIGAVAIVGGYFLLRKP